jgi:type IV secretion system protein TrbF
MTEMEKKDNRIIDGGYSSNESLSETNKFWKKVSIILALLLMIVCVHIGLKEGREKQIPENTVRHHLAKFVIHMRTVSMDPVITRANLEEAYAFTTLRAKGQLDKILLDIRFVEKRAEGIFVTVSIKSIIQKNKSLYTVAWAETEYRDAKAVSTVNYYGFFKLKFLPIRVDESFFPVNPSGVYIDNIVIERSSERK